MTSARPQQDGVFGFEQFASGNDQLNELLFIINSVLMGVNVATLVQVKGVTTSGHTGPVGFVDVLPLVNQLTGSGQAIQHTTVFQLPFFRLQGGSASVICDPQVGDVGIALICDRDISAVKAAVGLANPGSMRRFSFADGLYFGGWNRGVTPTKSVILDSTGCEITCDTNITGGVLKINGQQVVQGRLAAIPPPVGGTTVDVEARAAINALITMVQTQGLTS